MISIAGGAQLTAKQRQVLGIQAGRAQEFYNSAQALLPLIAADSRPSLWVLVSIYHRLLERIEQRGFDVFSEKIRVPTYEKLAILGRGMLKTILSRGEPGINL
jgi:phytoene synthase